jgi:LmbE family N-acetylglucosaminyl deacetylase
VVLFLVAPGRAQFPPAPGTGPGLAETIEAIDSAPVTTRVLYVTAHPDDESAAVLTYLARGLHADVALLSLTRGEGGQNALGPEQAPQLGLIRTQELLEATRGYGVKLYFTRAKDFGFSKTPQETQKVWGDQVLEDMVRVIRTFRPNIVINNWGDVHAGHGHHQAAGLLTPKAVALAADETAFRERFLAEGLRPWGSQMRPVALLDLERGVEKPRGYVLPLDDVSPLWGKTWREIGMDAFSNHRTQGVAVFFGNPFFRRPISLKQEGGNAPDPALLAVPLHAVAGDADGADCKTGALFCPVLKAAEEEIAAAHASVLALRWMEAAASLARAAQGIRSLYPGGSHAAHWVVNDPLLEDLKLAESRIERSLSLAAGLTIQATADRGALVTGEASTLTIQRRCRPEVACQFLATRIEAPPGWRETKTADEPGGGKFQLVPGKEGRRGAWDQQIPEAPALVLAALDIGIAGYQFTSEVPVTHIEASSTRVDRSPLRLVPAYTLSAEPRQLIRPIEDHGGSFEILVRVHSYSSKKDSVRVGAELPPGWTSSGEAKLAFEGTGDAYTKIKITPPAKLNAGNYTAALYAKSGDQKFTTSLEPLPSAPTLLWAEPAECVVHAFDINVPKNLKVGYITAESEPVPDSLRMLGVQVDLLDAAALNFGDLSKYDAIVVGVRAYELRSELPGANQRLLDYVSGGGTLVVQYERDFAWDGKNYAPYSTKIDGGPGGQLPRITDETAAVNFLKPDDPLLDKPNQITAKDFDGWVQERGLYFWTDFDATKYTPLLSMHDPGEKDLNGGLVYTKLGKGTYVYTGLAFFRQLPEGVPGAYRLFVNLLSASRSQ